MTLDAEGPTDEQRVAALVEELGEVARALTYDQDHAGDLTTELTQLAALAAAWATRLVGGDR
jgi:NTP pyrophosphatase (non-canonical NTP hydrolase)